MQRTRSTTGRAPRTQRVEASAAKKRSLNPWYLALGCVLVFLACLLVYSPALNGPFLFDDLFLPLADPNRAGAPIADWINGSRPVLFLTYWLEYQATGPSTFLYHVTNVAIHTINGVLAFFLVARLVVLAGIAASKRWWIAGFCALLFLFHPLQTESVAYISGRSESLAAMFFLAASVVFVYRDRTVVSWRVSTLILGLFALAILTKANSIVLVPVLMLIDVYFSADSWKAIKTDWRLYVPPLLASLFGLAMVRRILATSTSAGFAMPLMTWYQYLFTEARAIFQYLRMFVAPFGQSADHDFAISRNVLAHGAIVFMLLLAAIAVFAFLIRKRWPLASFGIALFFLLLAPTSSFVPLADPLVEHRMYLAILALSLIAAQALGAMRFPPAAGSAAILTAVLCLAAIASYRRNGVWSSTWTFWANAIENGPHKGRAYWNLTQKSVSEGACTVPVPYLQKADAFMPNDPMILLSWAEVLECEHKLPASMAKLKQAEQAAPWPKTFELEGLLYGEMGDLIAARAELEKAYKMDPSFAAVADDLARLQQAEELQRKQPFVKH